MSSPLERGKRRAEARQKAALQVFAKNLTKNVDVETLLLDKLMQRTKGGSSGLIQQFRKMDSTYGDDADISFDQFKDCLVKFGLEGLQDEDAMKLFKKYDTDNSNSVSFKEFSAQVANHFSEAQKHVGDTNTDIQDAIRAREKARIMKQQAFRTKWKTVSVNAEDLLLRKIEERLKGGPHSLRMSFRKFDNGRGGDSAIDFAEFQKTLQRFGLEGISSQDAKKLFDKFDDDGNGTIDFHEFTEFVMKSSSKHNSLSFNLDSAAKESKRLRENALKKQQYCSDLHWKYASKHDDIESLLIDKVLQKLKGGPHALRRAFCLFDQDRGDGAEIDINSFKAGLESLGLVDIPHKMVRRLFRKYDESGDGLIDFKEFVKQISRSCNPLDPYKSKKKKKSCCKHCCCHANHKGKRERLQPPSARSSMSSLSSYSSTRSLNSYRQNNQTQSHHLLPLVTGRKL